jgi:hypothetical protein
MDHSPDLRGRVRRPWRLLIGRAIPSPSSARSAAIASQIGQALRSLALERLLLNAQVLLFVSADAFRSRETRQELQDLLPARFTLLLESRHSLMEPDDDVTIRTRR